VQVFDASGNFIRQFGSPADNPINPLHWVQSVAVIRGGNIAVWSAGATSVVAFDIYKQDGTFLSRISDPLLFGMQNMSVMPDGLIAGAATATSISSASTIRILDPEGRTSIIGISTNNLNLGEPTFKFQLRGSSFDSDGRFYCNLSFGRTDTTSPGIENYDGIYIFERRFTTDRAVNAKAMSLPRIRKVVQRPNTSFVDIDYDVLDNDSALVETRILGFTNGVNTLSGLIKLMTLAEGTAANVGLNTQANSEKRITWDAAADWNVGFGNIQFEVLAKDERGMLPLHFITIPAGAGGVDPLKVSDKPVTDADLLSVWFWLIASNDTGIQFVNGEVFGTGADSAVKYATGVTTTAQGRTYVLNRLGVRAISTTPTNEVSRANAGRYGFPATVTASHVVKLP